jgi:hypothetical protein
MPAIGEITRAKIKGYLEAAITSLVLQIENEEVQEDECGLRDRMPTTLHPFHEAITPDEIRKLSRFNESLSAALETTFGAVAQLIAVQHHAEVKRDYAIAGRVSRTALKEIENQIHLFEQAVEADEEPPSLDEMIEAILDLRNIGAVTEKIAHSELFIRTYDGREFFFELGSPLPNRDQCYSILNNILYNHLIRGLPRPQVQSYFAMAYNPYGPERKDYKWSVAKMYLPFEQATLIGHEFWNMVGGPTAYEELLDIYHEVGRDKSKHILDSLVFGF